MSEPAPIARREFKGVTDIVFSTYNRTISLEQKVDRLDRDVHILSRKVGGLVRTQDEHTVTLNEHTGMLTQLLGTQVEIVARLSAQDEAIGEILKRLPSAA